MRQDCPVVDIMHVISSPDGFAGAERILVALLREGAQRGMQQLVVNPFGDPHGVLAARVEGFAAYEAWSVGTPAALPATRRRLHRLIVARRPQLVHAHLFHAAALLASLPREGAPWLLSHHHGVQHLDQGKRLRGLVDMAAARRFDCVVAVSGPVRAGLVERMHVPPSRVRTIPNGWEGQPLPRRPAGRAQLLAVGQLRQEKGHADLLRALPAILQAIPEAELIVAGDGPERQSLERIAVELGVSESVRFAGVVEDVWPLLATADIFVMPSRQEPFGIALAEAMAAGVPVVATRTGGIPELVDDGRCGVLTPPEDPKALAMAVLGVLADPDRADALAAAGLERAAGLPMSRTVAEYFDLYAQMIDGSGGR